MFETLQVNPYIADEDIVCYKSVYSVQSRDGKKKHVISKIVGYEYTIGELNEEIDIHVSNRVYTEVDKSKFLVVKEGYHSYIRMRDIVMCGGENILVVECVIPKGSKYFIDTNKKQYVSSNIIIKSIINYEQ